MRVVDGLKQLVPLGPVDILELQSQVLNDVRVQALGVQGLGDVVDARGVRAADDGINVDVAHAADLVPHGVRHRAVRADHDGVRLDADGAQRCHRVLGRLGLQFLGRADVRNQRDVQEEDVVAADVLAHLAGRFEERLGLDVADRAADFGDDDIRGLLRLGGQAHPALDLVGDVRDDLDGVTEVFAAAFLGDHGGVHLAGGDVGGAVEALIEEALVVADVEVGFGAVVGHEDFAVLEGIHCARIHIEVGIELLHGHREAACPKQVTEAGSRQSLTEGGRHAAGDEDVFGRRRRLGKPGI